MQKIKRTMEKEIWGRKKAKGGVCIGFGEGDGDTRERINSAFISESDLFCEP